LELPDVKCLTKCHINNNVLYPGDTTWRIHWSIYIFIERHNMYFCVRKCDVRKRL